MSSFPVNPRGTAKRGFGVGLFGLLFILLIGGYFIYNMAPNLISSVIPGGGNGLSGEWVGLVKVQNDMMNRNSEPAALKLTMKPAALGSIIPTYKVTGVLTGGSHTTPATFTVEKMMTGHEIVDLSGFTDEGSIPGLKGAVITGGLKDKTLTFNLHAMSANSTMELDGTLHKGTDADYDALIKQLQ